MTDKSIINVSFILYRTNSKSFFSRREPTLSINEKDYSDYITYDDKVKCLKSAINEFETQIMTAAENFKHHKYGVYLWLYTPDFIRQENVEGLYRLIYLKHIVKLLSKQYTINEIILRIVLPEQIKDTLRSYCNKLEINKLSLIKYVLVNNIFFLKDMIKICFHNLVCLFSKSNESFSGSLIDVSQNIKKHRYGDIKNIEDVYKNIKYYSGEQLPVNNIRKDKGVVFKREINPMILVMSFKKAFGIMFFIFKIKNKIPAELYSILNKKINYFYYTDLNISMYCIRKYLNKAKIKFIIQSSTLTKPIYRILITESVKKNIFFIQVASRSLSYYRASDRLFYCDCKGYNNTHIPNYFILRDEYSKNVFEKYPQIKENTMIGGRYTDIIPDTQIVKSDIALFFLFNKRTDINIQNIKEVKSTGLIEDRFTILYRFHPGGQRIDDIMNHSFPNNRLIDISGKKYDEILNYRTIILTGPTTAAFESLKYGALIFWIPYIWDQSIFMDDIMMKVGVMNKNNQELKNNLKIYMESEKQFEEKLKKDKLFTKRFLMTEKSISDCLDTIYNKSKNI